MRKKVFYISILFIVMIFVVSFSFANEQQLLGCTYMSIHNNCNPGASCVNQVHLEMEEHVKLNVMKVQL